MPNWTNIICINLEQIFIKIISIEGNMIYSSERCMQKLCERRKEDENTF